MADRTSAGLPRLVDERTPGVLTHGRALANGLQSLAGSVKRLNGEALHGTPPPGHPSILQFRSNSIGLVGSTFTGFSNLNDKIRMCIGSKSPLRLLPKAVTRLMPPGNGAPQE